MYNQSLNTHYQNKDILVSESEKKLEERESLNFSNVRRDLDYSINSDSNLDIRVLKVCQEAENNFLENQRAIKEIKKLKNTDFKYRFSSNRYGENNDYRETRDINYSTISHCKPSGISEMSHSPLVTFSNNSNNTHRDSYFIRNQEEKENFEKEKLGKIVNFDKFLKNSNSYNNVNENHNLNIKNSNRSLSSLKVSNSNKNDKNNFQVQEVSNESLVSNRYKIPIKHKHLKSGKKCIACELKKR